MAEDYAILGQRSTSAFIGGVLERVWVVSYRTTDGDLGEVEVPVGQYTADRVHELIRAEVSELRAARRM